MSELRKIFLSVREVVDRIAGDDVLRGLAAGGRSPVRVFGVPRGGIPIAMAAAAIHGFEPVETAEEADVIVDDIVDSGTTRNFYRDRCPNAVFVALWTKGVDCPADCWLCFPWEESKERDEADSLARVLEHFGLPTGEEEMRALREFLASRAAGR